MLAGVNISLCFHECHPLNDRKFGVSKDWPFNMEFVMGYSGLVMSSWGV